MRTSALFGAKNSRFFEIYGVSARTRRSRASADILRTRERGNFCDLVRTSFMDGPAPNQERNLMLVKTDFQVSNLNFLLTI